MLEDVIYWETLLSQRPALHNAAILVGRTQKDLRHTEDVIVVLFLDLLWMGKVTCSEFSLVRNLRWVTAGYLSLLRGSVVQRRNRDGSSSVSMRHFSFTTLTTTWTHESHESCAGGNAATPMGERVDLVELDWG